MLVIEAHLPTAGVLGSAGATGLVVGTLLVVLGAGVAPVLLVPVATLTGVASLWLGLAAARRVRIPPRAWARTGAGAPIGRLRVGRRAAGPAARGVVAGAPRAGR